MALARRLATSLLAAAACATAHAQDAAMLAGLLRGDASGYATPGRDGRFRFPADHGAHPEYRTESWRFTGNLSGPQGRRFGFELTFLRVGVVPPGEPIGPSSWATRNVYWAQFVLDDAQSGRRHSAARLERAARGMSGADGTRIRVRDWSIVATDNRQTGFALRAAQDGIELELRLRGVKPALTRSELMAGERNGRAPFHAYAVTRLDAAGHVRLGEQRFAAEGFAWLDRAWGEVPLPLGALVWDRALLQLADGRDLMVVRMRRRDGSGEPSTTGLVIARDGTARVLREGEVALDTVDPWRVRVPAQGLALELEPRVPVQRDPHGVFAWSGAVGVRGAAEGHGYVEIAGGER